MKKLQRLLSSPLFLLVVVVIIATFLRLNNLATVPPGLYPDEAMNGNNALEALRTGDFRVFYPENNGREGLFINIQALSVAVFGNEPWALRVVSALFGILTVIGVYLATRELLNGHPRKELVALAAAFFVATSFWHLNFSRIGFRAIMAPAFLTWSVYFLVKSFNRAVRKRPVSDGETPAAADTQPLNAYKVGFGALLLSAVGGLLYGLGMHSYLAYRATPLVICAIVFMYWKWRMLSLKQIVPLFAVFVVTALVAFAPLGIYFIQHPQDFMGRTSQVSVFASLTPVKDFLFNIVKTVASFYIIGDFNWRHNVAGSPHLYWFVALLFTLGVAVGCARVFKKRLEAHEKLLFWTALVWIAVAALPVVISNEGIPHALRSILMIPPVFMLAGLGVLWAYEALCSRIKPQVLAMLVGFIIAVLVGQVHAQYFVRWASNPHVADAFASRYAEIGREINTTTPAIAKYVVVNVSGVDVRGVPMPAQTVMFITDTFLPQQQKEKNITYVLDDTAPQTNNGLIFYLEQQ